MPFTKPSPRWSNTLRYVGYVACLLGMAVGGSVYSFNAYSDALKAQLDFSQSQVEWLLSIGVLATSLGFTAGPLIERFGPHPASCAAAILSGAGCLLLGMAVEKRIAHSFVVMCFILILPGQGSIGMYMIALMSTAVNFPVRVRATLFGLLDCMFGGSAVLWSTVYGVSYGQSADVLQQNVAGFLYMMACVSAGVGLVMFSVVYHLPWQDNNTASATRLPDRNSALGSLDGSNQAHVPVYDSEDSATESVRNSPTRSNVQSEETEERPLLDASTQVPKDTNILRLLRDVEFHLLIWPFVIVSSVTTMFIANISFYVKSARLGDEYRKLLTILIPGVGLVARVICGFSSDRLHRHVPRVYFILATSFLLSLGLIPLRTDVDRAWALVLLSVLMPIAAGAVWTLVPTIVSELSGKYFGLNWGCIMFTSGLFSLVFQVLFGAVYDAHTTAHHTTAAPEERALGKPPKPTPATCYGSACSDVTNDIILCCSWLATVSLLVLAIRQRVHGRSSS